jgi:branched-chain amino acid transport system ATP-binding protein
MADATSSQLVVGNVTVEFGGLVALRDVSLTARAGEIVGVIGPNGAGKTTLFNVICGFVRPSAGTLVFAGRRLRRQHPHDLTKLGIARTMQAVGMCAGLNLVENVMMGAQYRARANFAWALFGMSWSSREEARLRVRALELLDRFRIAQYAAAYPAALPYGIQKRAALARALIAEPKLLLLDEPASGQSAADIDELGRLLQTLRADMGVLLVEHYMDLVMSVCDRIVVLDFGEVISSGTPDQVRADPAVTTAYLGEDVKGFTSKGATVFIGDDASRVIDGHGSEADA